MDERMETLRAQYKAEMETLSASFLSRMTDVSAVIDREYAERQEDLVERVRVLTAENDALRRTHATFDAERTRLTARISGLEEEHLNFTKVSKLIAIENDNARLKAEVSSLKNAIATAKGPCATTTADAHSQTEEIQVPEVIDMETQSHLPTIAEAETQTEVEAKVEVKLDAETTEDVKLDAKIDAKLETDTNTTENTPEKQCEPEESIHVKEKKIGKATYYVDQNNVVYQRMEDGTMGEKVGEIRRETDNGKTKGRVVWY